MKIKDLSAAGPRRAILCKPKGIIKAGKQETITRMIDITSKIETSVHILNIIKRPGSIKD